METSVDKTEGRKTFVSCKVTSTDGSTLHTEASGNSPAEQVRASRCLPAHHPPPPVLFQPFSCQSTSATYWECERSTAEVTFHRCVVIFYLLSDVRCNLPWCVFTNKLHYICLHLDSLRRTRSHVRVIHWNVGGTGYRKDLRTC